MRSSLPPTVYNRRITLRATLAAAALVIAASPASAQSTFAPVAERHLDNGMTILVQEDHKVPLVSLTLRYDAAAGAVPAGLEGTAALTTSVMMRATKHVGPGDYTRLLARAGASGVNDRTGGGSTVLEVTVPANRIALPLWLWSDQMAFFDQGIDDAQLEQLRTKLREQRRASLEGSPMARVDRIADEELYGSGHPYRSLYLVPQDVDHVDRAAIVAFHDAWITPSHATLAIVGDVPAADAFDLVERYFRAIPRSAAETPAAAPPAATLTAERRVTVAANVPRAHVSIRWPTPKLFTVEDAHLDVLARLLAGTRTAWLYWKLVDDAKIATSVTARERSSALGSQFEVLIDGAKDKPAADLLAAFDSAMDELRSRITTTRELDGALYETLIDRQLSLERPATRAAEYAKAWALTGVADFLGKDFERYDHVTASLVRETLKKYLPKERRVALLVVPTPSALAGGERSGGAP